MGSNNMTSTPIEDQAIEACRLALAALLDPDLDDASTWLELKTKLEQVVDLADRKPIRGQAQ